MNDGNPVLQSYEWSKFYGTHSPSLLKLLAYGYAMPYITFHTLSSKK